MTATYDDTLPVGNILHPSDFSAASEVAFAHALKAALLGNARLTLMHVSMSTDEEWTDFPGVRDTLARWGVLPHDAAPSSVPSLGVQVRKVVASHDDPVRSVLTFLERHPAELIVLATHQQQGRSGWLRRSVSEPIARRSGQMTLFIPHGVEGFVSRHDGSVSLRKVLIPIAPTPRAQPAVSAAARLVHHLQCPTGTFTTLFVGAPGDAPAIHHPVVPGWWWSATTATGSVVDGIVRVANDTNADLIVMSTEGRDGFLDALRGSHSERVLRQARCPLLAIPAEAAVTQRLG